MLKWSLLSSALFLTVVSGCAKNDSNNSNPAAAAQNPPPATVQATSTPVPAPVWKSLQEEFEDSQVTGNTCAQPKLITIQSNGKFKTATCSTDGNDFKQGTIRQDELAHLSRLVEQALSSLSSSEVECNDLGTPFMIKLEVTKSNGKVRRIYDEGLEHGQCWYGNHKDDDDLQKYSLELLNKYYPTPPGR